ncbi:MAG: type I methionyl aminopeptidase [Phycisphaerales bacterium]
MTLKTPAQIALMHQAGRIVHATLTAVASAARPGVATCDLDLLAEQIIKTSGGESLFRGYPARRNRLADSIEVPGFSGCICVSINEEVVHGIPRERRLVEGDLVSLDCGVRFEGWCADAAITIPVGAIQQDEALLLEAAQQTLRGAIQAMQPGRRWSTVAAVMERRAEMAGFGVVREFVGHGIGRELHEQPQVPGFISDRFRQQHDFTLEPGMTLAVEPMLTLGSPATETLDDGWTVVTVDRVPAAHFEHTIAITPTGPLVLTDGCAGPVMETSVIANG